MMGTLDGKSQLYHLPTIMTIAAVNTKKYLLTENLSESYKSSPDLSEIATKCKRLHLNL